MLDQSRHLIFTGNPGTGKTTVARLLAQIYRTLGVVERGHLVETDRAGLVAGFVGQTAGRVVAAFDRAEGGVLLVDEAYSLARGGEDDFGREAIDTAGQAGRGPARPPGRHPGRLPRRDGRRWSRPTRACGRGSRRRSTSPTTATTSCWPSSRRSAPRAATASTTAAGPRCGRWLAAQPRDRGFGNGRLARNLFEAAVANQATRLVALDRPTDEQLTTLTAADVPAVEGLTGRLTDG